MTTINVNTIESSTSTLTIGESGNSVVAADSVNVNLIKDASGATMWQSNGSGVLSNVNSGFGDSLVLISTQTASNSASVSFTTGIDATYKEYIFKFINIAPAVNTADFSFQVNASGQSGYDETITSTYFHAYHRENDEASPSLLYVATADQAQGTAYQKLGEYLGSDATESMVGELHLFNPSSTTYVKNFYGRFVENDGSPPSYARDQYPAGYINVTAAITSIDFKMNSGNIAAGTIKMYGVK